MLKALRQISEEELAPIMKYFPEWKTRIRNELSIEGKDKMAFFINSCKFSEEEAKVILKKFEESIELFKEQHPNSLTIFDHGDEEFL